MVWHRLCLLLHPGWVNIFWLWCQSHWCVLQTYSFVVMPHFLPIREKRPIHPNWFFTLKTASLFILFLLQILYLSYTAFFLAVSFSNNIPIVWLEMYSLYLVSQDAQFHKHVLEIGTLSCCFIISEVSLVAIALHAFFPFISTVYNFIWLWFSVLSFQACLWSKVPLLLIPWAITSHLSCPCSSERHLWSQKPELCW